MTMRRSLEEITEKIGRKIGFGFLYNIAVKTANHGNMSGQGRRYEWNDAMK